MEERVERRELCGRLGRVVEWIEGLEGWLSG